jgi:hypothetical protein
MDTRAAYLAGLIDGEGYLSFQVAADRCRPFLKVGMNDERTIRWIHKQFGGTVAIRKANEALNIEQHFTWQVYRRKELLLILPAVLNWLICKKLHATVVLEFCQRFAIGDRQPVSSDDRQEMQKYVNFIHAINSKGVGSSALKERLHKAVGHEFPSFHVFPKPV